jgi:hypothetical protein
VCAQPIVPLGSKQDEQGEPVWLLRPEDTARIAQGYGCPKCLRSFEMYLERCPDCGHEIRDVQIVDIVDAPDWHPGEATRGVDA